MITSEEYSKKTGGTSLQNGKTGVKGWESCNTKLTPVRSGAGNVFALGKTKEALSHAGSIEKSQGQRNLEYLC